jgi:hypothetical protein
MNNGTRPQAEDASALCRTCGACCSYSLEWPRFSLENDAVLDLIPPAFVDDEQGRTLPAGACFWSAAHLIAVVIVAERHSHLVP